MLVRPPAFDASQKYPVIMLLHGGPQTQWGDSWSYRWNPQMFAAPGYVVVMINRADRPAPARSSPTTSPATGAASRPRI